MADLPRSFTLVQRKGVSGYQKLKGLLDKGDQKDLKRSDEALLAVRQGLVFS